MKIIPPIKEILDDKELTTNARECLLEQYFRFDGVPKKKQPRIIELLGYCKELRNTAYPMKGSNVREVELVEFSAHKEKDIIFINGSLHLEDGDKSENRVFEAYILEDKDKTTIYLDVTRLCVEDEPKMIRTSETFVETNNTVLSVTKYAGCGLFEDKVFQEEFPIPERIIEQPTTEKKLS